MASSTIVYPQKLGSTYKETKQHVINLKAECSDCSFKEQVSDNGNKLIDVFYSDFSIIRHIFHRDVCISVWIKPYDNEAYSDTFGFLERDYIRISHRKYIRYGSVSDIVVEIENDKDGRPLIKFSIAK